MGAVIPGRHVRVEAVVVEPGQAGSSVVIRPYPVRESLFYFVGLLHGGGGQFLVQNRDGPALFVALAGFLFHLDGLVHQKGFNDFFRRVFRDAPDGGIQRDIVQIDTDAPSTERGQVIHLLRAFSAMQMFDEVRYDGRRKPGGAELDADVHGFYVGRQSLRKRFHIGQKARVGACGVPCLTQFCPDIAREILIPDFPEFRGGVEKNKTLFLQVPLNDIGGASEKLLHAGEVHLAAFPKRYDKGILGAFRLLRERCRFKHALSEYGSFSGGSGSGLPAGLAGHIRRNALVVVRFQGFQQCVLRVFPHEAAVGL